MVEYPLVCSICLVSASSVFACVYAGAKAGGAPDQTAGGTGAVIALLMFVICFGVAAVNKQITSERTIKSCESGSVSARAQTVTRQ